MDERAQSTSHAGATLSGFDGQRHFVGLGFGPIQAGLFVYEAQRTGRYAPPLVVDVRADLVAALRSTGGRFELNIARADRRDVVGLGPVEVADSTLQAHRALVVQAIAAADELATALPSVAFYRTDDPWSPHRLLADGLRRRTSQRPLLVYCAENHREAAALLEAAVLAELRELAELDEPGALGEPGVPVASPGDIIARARFVDTVIGKMSGVISDAGELSALGLATITPTLPQAFLVEEFDRILVSRVDPPGAAGALHPGIPVLREVDDLAPFEAAKLLGHNAIHALAGFLGAWLGLLRVAELRAVPGAMAFLRAAFLEESGRTLRARFGGSDPLFSEAGYRAFADDLLARMVNPHLADTIERAGRDARRKLGWEDRLVGLLRMALVEGVPAPRVAMGVAAGVGIVRRTTGASPDEEPGAFVRSLWPENVDPAEAQAVLESVREGEVWLERWLADGFGALDGLAAGSVR